MFFAVSINAPVTVTLPKKLLLGATAAESREFSSGSWGNGRGLPDESSSTSEVKVETVDADDGATRMTVRRR